MNPGRGWNPNLEGSYLLDYRESEAEMFTHGTKRFYLCPVKFSSPEPSPISIYSESPNMTSFCLLGFSSMKPQSSVVVAVVVFWLHKNFFQGGYETMVIFFNGYIRYKTFSIMKL